MTDMTDIKNEEAGEKKSLNFIEQAIENDLKAGKNGGKVQTRFPPEPNGYLHIGHAKAICLDFGIAAAHGGVCNLRFDDTNPTKEDMEYVEAIQEDIRWLGFQWGNVYYASDYFQQLWDFAVTLIKEGKAYVDEQTSEQIAQQKGTPTQPGVESPYRNRPIEESLALFEKMNSDEAKEGSMVLRAKIDMASPNMHFRDPIMYRILHVAHHRTGTQWKAYPMYDFAHGQSDYFEGVTHSLCTLEFVPHRPLYDLFIDWLKEGKDLDDNRPRQTEFNKLNLNYTLMSKRNLLILVKEGLVNDWDDPRMPTLCGFRRRGYSPESIRKFIDKIGYTTYDALNDFALLESAVREDLNARATRVSAVLNPVKLIITNYPEGQVEELEAINNPEDPKILCVGNNPDRQNIYSAALGLYNSRIVRLINKKGKLKSSIIIDELPTIYFRGLDNLIATARSNKVAVCLSFQDFSQLERDYGQEEAKVIENTVGNIFAGQVLGDTAKTLSERFGRIVQLRTSNSLSNDNLTTSTNTQLDSLIPASKISNLSQGMFVGAVADNFDERIEQKIFHAEIVIDREKLAGETASYVPIPEISSFRDADGVDRMEEIIRRNYTQIKEDVTQIIKRELRRIAEDPALRHLLAKK